MHIQEHFGEETNVIAILLKEMKAKQLHNYLIGLLEDQKFHYSSKSPGMWLYAHALTCVYGTYSIF